MNCVQPCLLVVKLHHRLEFSGWVIEGAAESSDTMSSLWIQDVLLKYWGCRITSWCNDFTGVESGRFWSLWKNFRPFDNTLIMTGYRPNSPRTALLTEYFPESNKSNNMMIPFIVSDASLLNFCRNFCPMWGKCPRNRRISYARKAFPWRHHMDVIIFM